MRYTDELDRKERQRPAMWLQKGSLMLGLALIITLSGCGVAGVGSSSFLTVQLINTENCTAVEVRDANGRHLTDIPAGGAAEEEIYHSSYERRDQVTLIASTVGEVPEGCEDWGTDEDTFRLDDDDDTETWKIRLDPPDHLD